MLDDAHRLVWDRLGQRFGTAIGQRELLPTVEFSDDLSCDCCGRDAADWVAPTGFLHESYNQELINCPSCRVFTSQQPDALCIDRAVKGTTIGMKLQSIAGGMLVIPPAPAPVRLMIGGKYLERPWGDACEIVPVTGNAQLAHLLDNLPPVGSVVIELSLRVERYTRHLRCSRDGVLAIATDTGSVDVPTADWPALKDAYRDLTNTERAAVRSLAHRLVSGAINPSSTALADAIEKQPKLGDFFANLPVDPFAARIYLAASTVTTGAST